MAAKKARKSTTVYYPKCPFYHSERPTHILCEKLLPSGMSSINSFRSKNAKNRYKKDFCCDNFKMCPLCRALYEKYGDDSHGDGRL